MTVADTMPVGESGNWRVVEIDTPQRRILYEGATCWMEGGPNEEALHKVAVDEAHRRGGVVLTTGLGLGMFPDLCLQSPNVQRVDIVERCQDVINLTWPTLQAKYGNRVRLILADAMTWTPWQGYSVIWHDFYATVEEGQAIREEVELRYAWWCEWQGFWRL